MPVWEMGDWVVWRRAFSTPWPPCTYPRRVTACDTSTACSGNRLSTAGKRRRPTTGFASPILGRLPGCPRK